MACCLALLGYITWQIQQGQRGVGYSQSLSEKGARLRAEHAKLASANSAFEQKVKLLRPESVDPDLVDELARSTLGFAQKTDVVVILLP